jgi:hypothetical protein
MTIMGRDKNMIFEMENFRKWFLNKTLEVRMCDQYQKFRSLQLEILKSHSPPLTYRQKLKIISERWQEEKEARDREILPPSELIKYVSEHQREESLRLVKASIEHESESFWLDNTHEGDVMFMALMSGLIRNYPEKFVIQILQKFIYDPRLFIMSLHSLTLVEMSILYGQEEVLFFLLTRSPPGWVDTHIFKSEDTSMLSCLYYVLLQKADQVPLKEELIHWIRKGLSRGVDPNLELSSPRANTPLDIWYMGCPVYDTLYREGDPPVHVKNFVRFTGLRDVGKGFRDRSRHLPPPPRSDHSGVSGDTLFSVFHRVARDQKSKALIKKLIESKTLQWNLIFLNNKICKTECYLNMLWRGRIRDIIDEGFLAYFKTPTYMLYISSAGPPLQKIYDFVSQKWLIQICTIQNLPPVISDLYCNGFIPPTKKNIEFLSMKPLLVNRILSIIESRGGWRTWLRKISSPLHTCFSRVIITPPGLSMISEDPHWRVNFTPSLVERLVESFREEHIQPYIDVQMEFTNEWFVNGDDVKDYVGKLPLFYTDDNFAFCQEDMNYLLKNPLNPFTRRELSLGETLRLGYINRMYEDWWLILDSPLKMDELRKFGELKVTYLTEKIDEYFESNPFLVYGERLSIYVSKLDSIQKIHATYLTLLSNPSILAGDIMDPLSQACIPFRSPDDCFQVEMVNIFYGMDLVSPPEDQNGSSQMLIRFLAWVLCVLESTASNESLEKLNGRIFSLYIIMISFIKNLGTLRLQA